MTPAFSGVPVKGVKIKSSNLTPAFSGAHIRADVLRNPRVLGCPETRGQNEKWLPHPYLLGGPNEGGNAESPLHSQGSPTPSAGGKIRSGPPQWGKQTEMAASPLPSRGRCYVTTAFSGVPIKSKTGCLCTTFIGRAAAGGKHPAALRLATSSGRDARDLPEDRCTPARVWAV